MPACKSNSNKIRSRPCRTWPDRPSGGDKWIYRLVVIALGLTGLFVVVGVFTLKALNNDTTIPDALVAIGSAAIAALAALLAPTPL